MGAGLRIGLLGASRIAPKAVLAPARERDDVTVTVVGARDADKARAYAHEHGIAHAVDYAELVAHPEVDLVYVALPPSEHLHWTRAALEAGKAVLVEKPFAMDAGEAQALTDAAVRAGRPLLEAFHYRFHAAFARAQAALDEGRIGAVRSVEAVFDAPIPQRPGELRWTPRLGGGGLMDLGCYCVHALRTLLRAEPEVVSATLDVRDGVDASARAELRFGSTPGAVSCSMLAEARDDHLVLAGERGRLEFHRFVSPQMAGRLEIVGADGAREALSVEGPTSYAAQLDHVVEVVAGRAEPLTGGADAVAQARALDAIYAAGGLPPRR